MSAFDHTALDDVIHGRLRLGVMAYLSTVSPAPFLELKAKVNATDGNLSTHLAKLEEAISPRRRSERAVFTENSISPQTPCKFNVFNNFTKFSKSSIAIT